MGIMILAIVCTVIHARKIEGNPHLSMCCNAAIYHFISLGLLRLLHVRQNDFLMRYWVVLSALTPSVLIDQRARIMKSSILFSN